MTDISPLILEGYSIAFQNGMTLENPMKIERFMARRLRSCVFVKNFEKTWGYLGNLNSIFLNKRYFGVTLD